MPAPDNTPHRPIAWPLKLLLGCTIAFGLLAAMLGALEIGLHLSGYGHSPKFYRTERAADGTAWIRENRWVTAPYFAPEIIRRPQPFRIPARKAPGTCRVFVLGSSAAMGDPEASFSIARVLEVLLYEAHPQIRFEIVNAGITAINSTVVRGIAADCAELEPDIFIVYEGNNEVIGPFGPGTVFSPFLGSPAAVRAAVALKRSRTGQLLAASARRFGANKTSPNDWGGMGMFLQHGIANDDPRLSTTRELFRENLTAIADSGRAAGATVLLCTVATNRREFAPFLSRHKPGLAPAALARWQEAFDSGLAAHNAGEHHAAATHFAAAAAIDDQHAETLYLLGHAQLESGDLEHGQANLQRALDLDILRFRTDSQLNAVIRSLGATARDGLHVVDLAAKTDACSPQGVTGDEHLYEHVHFNIRGAYRVAYDLCEAIESDLRRRGIVSANAPAPTWASLPLVREHLAYTTYEQGMIVRELLSRFSRPPFAGQRDNDARLARYRLMDQTVALLLGRPEMSADLARSYETAIAARPDDWVLRRNAGMAFVATGQSAKGLPLLAQAAATIPDDPDTLFAIAQANKTLGDAVQARSAFTRLRALEPRYPGLPPK